MRTRITDIQEYFEELIFNNETDIGSQMEAVTGILQALNKTLKPSKKKKVNDGMDYEWNVMCEVVESTAKVLKALADPEQIGE